jgi:hypothetical protein
MPSCRRENRADGVAPRHCCAVCEREVSAPPAVCCCSRLAARGARTGRTALPTSFDGGEEQESHPVLFESDNLSFILPKTKVRSCFIGPIFHPSMPEVVFEDSVFV